MRKNTDGTWVIPQRTWINDPFVWVIASLATIAILQIAIAFLVIIVLVWR